MEYCRREGLEQVGSQSEGDETHSSVSASEPGEAGGADRI